MEDYSKNRKMRAGHGKNPGFGSLVVKKKGAVDNIGKVLHGMRRTENCFPQKKEAQRKNCG